MIYDLEDRTLQFAKEVRSFIKSLPRTLANTEDSNQVIRSSGSIGANYIEANESFSKKDFIHRCKISRKEAKETIYWLKLIDVKNNLQLENNRNVLIEEATQLMNIFGSIIRKTEIT
jgi:four helix bundle protein